MDSDEDHDNVAVDIFATIPVLHSNCLHSWIKWTTSATLSQMGQPTTTMDLDEDFDFVNRCCACSAWAFSQHSIARTPSATLCASAKMQTNLWEQSPQQLRTNPTA